MYTRNDQVLIKSRFAHEYIMTVIFVKLQDDTNHKERNEKEKKKKKTDSSVAML